MMADPAEQPARWYTTNLVGVPAPVLASTAYQAHPVPLAIAGVREAHGGLFALLQRCAAPAEAQQVFGHYMDLSFALGPADAPATGPRRWRASWRKLLQGWGLDANGAAGAVLKGWVESRFGLVPQFHRAPLARFPSPAWVAYLEDKAHPRWNNNNVFQQLDLLYTFCQWALGRFALLPGVGDAAQAADAAGARHVTLWRGSTHVEEQLVAGSLRARHCTLRLNSVLSYALSAEQAGCFGDWVFRVQVPRAKLLVVPGLLPASLLQGEGEVIALGGDHVVEARYAC